MVVGKPPRVELLSYQRDRSVKLAAEHLAFGCHAHVEHHDGPVRFVRGGGDLDRTGYVGQLVAIAAVWGGKVQVF